LKRIALRIKRRIIKLTNKTKNHLLNSNIVHLPSRSLRKAKKAYHRPKKIVKRFLPSREGAF
jgi:hypothetical protein